MTPAASRRFYGRESVALEHCRPDPGVPAGDEEDDEHDDRVVDSGGHVTEPVGDRPRVRAEVHREHSEYHRTRRRDRLEDRRGHTETRDSECLGERTLESEYSSSELDELEHTRDEDRERWNAARAAYADRLAELESCW